MFKKSYKLVLALALTSASCTHQNNKPDRVAFSPNQRTISQDAEQDLPQESDKKYINLYETQWDSLKNIPVYDQSGFPACYSYAGAQFVEYFLRKNLMLTEANQHISPLWLAYNYKQNVSGLVAKKIKKNKDMTLGYGQAKKTIESLSEEGVCRDEVISQNLAKITGNVNLTDSDAIALIELVWQNKETTTEADIYSKVESDWRMLRIVKSSTHPYLSAEKKLNTNQIKAATVSVFNYINRKTNLDTEENSYINFFEDEVAVGCELPRNTVKHFIPDVKSVGKMYASNNAITKKIWRGFERMNFEYPVVIGYCSNVFKIQDSNHAVTKRSFAPRILQRSVQPSSKCSAHYSLVLGKKFNETTKNYDVLVRNTYGNEYMAVSNGCFCRNEATNQFEDCKPNSSSLVPPKNLTVLGCWLDQDKVASTVYDVISYKLGGQYITEEKDPQFEIQ